MKDEQNWFKYQNTMPPRHYQLDGAPCTILALYVPEGTQTPTAMRIKTNAGIVEREFIDRHIPGLEYDEGARAPWEIRMLAAQKAVEEAWELVKESGATSGGGKIMCPNCQRSLIWERHLDKKRGVPTYKVACQTVGCLEAPN